MQSTQLQIKKRVVYKHKNTTTSGAKGNRNETLDTTLPTLTLTGAGL